MKKLLLISCSIACLSIFSGCKKEASTESIALKEQTNRTVLTYMFQDSSIWSELTENINDMEQGWDPDTDGTLLVYVDASTHLTQFGGYPVLLEIQHDESNLIVSKIVKVYPDTDASDVDVFRQVQEDAMAMFPADSYGLIISAHGNGFKVNEPKTKLFSGSDRWSDNGLDIDVMADNLATHYDFMIFDACLMAETTTLYQLREHTDFVVASVELTPGTGFGYRTDLAALYTHPKADLYTFAMGSRDFYKNDPSGQEEIADNSYFTIGVYRMAAMDYLATTTKKVVEKLNMKYDNMLNDIEQIIANPAMKIMSSMYYPTDIEYGSPQYYDLNLLRTMLTSRGHNELAEEFNSAIEGVVMQKLFAFSEGFLVENNGYKTLSANLSFYIPNVMLDSKFQDAAFFTRFGWSAASGFTAKWN